MGLSYSREATVATRDSKTSATPATLEHPRVHRDAGLGLFRIAWKVPPHASLAVPPLAARSPVQKWPVLVLIGAYHGGDG
ncbi:hypothetical protein C4D60_Mb00t07060 [Musa balbisiana]|uniref:Uncharacterized protein n=1 Tax=Musa balbisiana TaxID=52838 RepID=A0A4V4H263_MUSBA|nr:hypothetical protein C4D60_Mb00t07060 [Musa balbisiana]